LVEDVVVAVIVEAVVEAVVDLLQILAELTSAPSLELRPHMSVNVIKRRGYVSSAKRRGIVFFDARSLNAKRR
jgi:hypothetical protein